MAYILCASITVIFHNHFSFYLSYLGMNYSNVIGFLLFTVFLLQFITGILLSSYYSTVNAYDSVSYIMIDVNVGWLIRFYHVLGASLFMVFIMVHWIRGIWIRLKIICVNECYYTANKISIDFIWLSGWVIFICSLLNAFVGYIPCWGQMSYWGITVTINILPIIPLFGFYIKEYVWCSAIVIINRMFIVHFCLGFIIGVLIVVHIYCGAN